MISIKNINTKALDKIKQWYGGMKYTILYNYEDTTNNQGTVIAVVLCKGRIDFLRLFTIGGNWELSHDKQADVKEMLKS